jgi:tetratricopeptide (TPR) repeat protein
MPEFPGGGLDGAGDLSRVARKPGESAEAWRTRGAALHTRYAYSKQALDRHDYAAAAGGFEAILMEEPGFLDAPQLLVQANAGLRVSAQDLYEAGNKLDAVGDWMGALQKYDQARLIHAGVPGLTAAMKRVRVKLQTAGTNAFNQARQHEANGRTTEAVKEYEKAFQWLPADDPNREIARTRIDQLKRHD